MALSALIGGPLILYHILSVVGVPAAVASGIVIVVVIKHLGLLAVLLTPVYTLLRRRPKH